MLSWWIWDVVSGRGAPQEGLKDTRRGSFYGPSASWVLRRGTGGLHRGVLIGRVTGANPIKGLGAARGAVPSLLAARAGGMLEWQGMLAGTWAWAREALPRGQGCRTQLRDTHPARALRHSFSLVAHVSNWEFLFIGWFV